MYARLRDTSPSVRKNAVLVLSHLILNDMMKVREAVDYSILYTCKIYLATDHNHALGRLKAI